MIWENPLIPHDERESRIKGAVSVREEIINFYTADRLRELTDL